MDRAVMEIVVWLDDGANFRTPPPKLSIRWKLSSAFTLHTLEMRRGRNSRCQVQTVNAKSYVGNDAGKFPSCNKGRNMKREGAKFLKVLCFFVSITLAPSRLSRGR